jgi:chemotaxis protein CheD
MRRLPIVQGEHKVVAEPGYMITTVLGSCVAVCLQDAVAKVGGMNHFLLAEPTPGGITSPADMQRYGIHAMELLINEMMRHGAVRERLRAHLYGGANVVAGLGDIGAKNAAFAREFVRMEGIGIGHCDLGGRHARKVEFLPYEGKARATLVAEPPPLAIAPAARRRRELVPAGDIELF